MALFKDLAVSGFSLYLRCVVGVDTFDLGVRLSGKSRDHDRRSKSGLALEKEVFFFVMTMAVLRLPMMHYSIYHQ
ncbi:hypothetical protein BJX65DRAFT_172458 [Aspergillus insuetus]